MKPDLVPHAFFLTRGVGTHGSRLVSFELALREAGIPQFNLVTVSSILPPACRQVSPEEGLAQLSAGEIVFCVLARAETQRGGEPIAAGVCLARLRDGGAYGYIAEHSGKGLSEAEVNLLTRSDAVEMLTTLSGSGGGEAFEFSSYAQAAVGAADGVWTTAVAAVVFILGEREHDERP
jgi:arginine decarboxylase